MGKRPAGILYWVDEKPPWGVTLVMALQHCLLMSSSLMLPVVIVREIGGTMTQAAAAVGMSMIAVGIGTLLQTISKGPIGSGYLCPNLCGPSYLEVSVQAAWLGGLPLMHGMIMVAGVFEALLSRIIGRLRFLFPNTVTGIVVLMVGIALIPLGTSKFLGIEIAGDPVDPMNAGIASLSLLLLIGLNLWTKGHLPLYNVLLGMVVAYLLSSWAGILDQSDWQ
jgi:NCS2 family nucleobase:cation symporter-2